MPIAVSDGVKKIVSIILVSVAKCVPSFLKYSYNVRILVSKPSALASETMIPLSFLFNRNMWNRLTTYSRLLSTISPGFPKPRIRNWSLSIAMPKRDRCAVAMNLLISAHIVL